MSRFFLAVVLTLGLNSIVWAQIIEGGNDNTDGPSTDEEPTVEETPVVTEVVPPPVVEETPPPPRRFAADGQTRNERAVADVLDANDDNPALRDVVNELRRLPPEQQDDAFDQIAPVDNDAVTEGGFDGARRHNRRVTRHMDDTRVGRGAGEIEGAWTPWVDTGFADGNGRSTPESSDYDLTGTGFSAGIDYGFGESFLLGFTYGFDRTDIDYDDTDSKGQVDGDYYGTYFIFYPGHGFVQVALDQAEHAYETDRHLQFGQINRVARSDHDGSGRSAFLGTGYEFRPGKWRISPRTSVQYITLDQDGYTEEGAGSLDLTYDKQTDESVEGSLAMRVDYAGGTKLLRIRPHVMLGWGRQFETKSRDITAKFEGTDSFSITGPESDSDTVEVEAGVTAGFLKWTAFLTYGAAFDADSQNHVVDIGVRSRF